VLSSHYAKSPESVCVASPGHAMGHCKVKCSLCSAQKVWWSLHWVVELLRQGWTGGLWELRFCQILECFSGGGCAQQILCTEHCQCVCDQPWACHGALQGQMHPQQCSAGVVELALGAAAGLDRWFVKVTVFCQILGIFSFGVCAQQPLRTEPCQCVCDQPWVWHGALQGQMQHLQCSAGVVEPVLGAAAGLGRWFVGVAVLPDSGVFQWWGTCSATTEHIFLCLCARPALGMPWGTQGHIHPPQYSAGMVDPALGAAAVLGRWILGNTVLPHSKFY